MVLEDNIAAQFSSFMLNCSLLNGPRNIFTSSYKLVMYKQNCRWINNIPPGIIVPNDHLQCHVSFFPGEHGDCCCCYKYARQQQRWLVCVSLCTQKKKINDIIGKEWIPPPPLILYLLFCQSGHAGRIWSNSREIPADSVSNQKTKRSPEKVPWRKWYIKW